MKAIAEKHGYDTVRVDFTGNDIVNVGIPEDTIGIVYSGHGSGETLGHVPLDVFKDWIRRLEQRPKFVVLRSCHSHNFLNEVDSALLDNGKRMLTGQGDILTISRDGYSTGGWSDDNILDSFLLGEEEAQDHVLHSYFFDALGIYVYGNPNGDPPGEGGVQVDKGKIDIDTTREKFGKF
jgi:hypothetical protein